jgi:hypothetical protein
MRLLAGKVALITGAARGQGRSQRWERKGDDAEATGIELVRPRRRRPISPICRPGAIPPPSRSPISPDASPRPDGHVPDPHRCLTDHLVDAMSIPGGAREG